MSATRSPTEPATTREEAARRAAAHLADAEGLLADARTSTITRAAANAQGAQILADVAHAYAALAAVLPHAADPTHSRSTL